MTIWSKIRELYIFTIARRLPDCATITRMASDAMERKLPLRQRIVVRLHLHICEWCMRYREQIQFLRQALRDIPEDQPPTNLSSEAKERIKKNLTPDPS